MGVLKPLACAGLVAALLGCAPMAPALAQEPESTSDSALKAAFLFNFAKFTEWPALPPGQPLVLCVVGDQRIADALAEIVRGKTIGDRGLHVPDTTDLSPEACHVLFVSRSEARALKGIVDALKTRPILTVSDGKGFAQSGGIVEFVIERDQMRFIANPKAATRAGLKLSSRLLGLARIVDEDHGY
ncbi:MAG TPA: YfiR family protein [Vicinamibacterales bacterium]|nr:YfiR family protein [Vicinamibacterales bacterium]